MLRSSRTLILAAAVAFVGLSAGPSLADHNGVFDVAKLREQPVASHAVTHEQPSWFARVQSWLHKATNSHARRAVAPEQRN